MLNNRSGHQLQCKSIFFILTLCWEKWKKYNKTILYLLIFFIITHIIHLSFQIYTHCHSIILSFTMKNDFEKKNELKYIISMSHSILTCHQYSILVQFIFMNIMQLQREFSKLSRSIYFYTANNNILQVMSKILNIHTRLYEFR